MSFPNMNDLSSKLPWKMRELTDKLTNVVMNYTEVEAKVREATNEDPWGPTGPQMQEISRYSFTYETYHEAMSMLWKRLMQDREKSWRRVYKSLLVLDYLLKNGSERVVTSAKEHLFELKQLCSYKYIDEAGKDQGLNVRNRARDMVDCLQDDERLRDERKKARKTKDKFIGMSNDEAQFRTKDWTSSSSTSGSHSTIRGNSAYRDTPAERNKYDEDVDDGRYEWQDDPDSITERVENSSISSRRSKSKPGKAPSVVSKSSTPPNEKAKNDFDLLGELDSASGAPAAPVANGLEAVFDSPAVSGANSGDFADFGSAFQAPAVAEPAPVSDFVADFSSINTSAPQISSNTGPPTGFLSAPPAPTTAIRRTVEAQSPSSSGLDIFGASTNQAAAAPAPQPLPTPTPQTNQASSSGTGRPANFDPFASLASNTSAQAATASPNLFNSQIPASISLNTLSLNSPDSNAARLSTTSNTAKQHSQTKTPQATKVDLGSTWKNVAGSVDISLDSLVSPSSGKTKSPSMFELAAKKDQEKNQSFITHAGNQGSMAGNANTMSNTKKPANDQFSLL